MKLFLRGLKYPPNEDQPWRINFILFDQEACDLIDNANRYADQDQTELQKCFIWNTANLTDDFDEPVFPPERSVLKVT